MIVADKWCQSIISYYLPTLLTNVGIKDTNTKLLLNLIYALVGWIFSSAGSRFHDIIGRRKMFMGSTLGMIICLSITAATAATFVNTGSQAAASTSIAFIFVFGAVFSWAFTSMQPIYPAEVMSNDMRAKGMGTFKITAGAAGFLNTFVGPIALSNVCSLLVDFQTTDHWFPLRRSGIGSMCFSYSGILSSSALCISSSSRPKTSL